MQYQKTMKLNLKIFGDVHVHVDLYVNEIYISKLINCEFEFAWIFNDHLSAHLLDQIGSGRSRLKKGKRHRAWFINCEKINYINVGSRYRFQGENFWRMHLTNLQRSIRSWPVTLNSIFILIAEELLVNLCLTNCLRSDAKYVHWNM